MKQKILFMLAVVLIPCGALAIIPPPRHGAIPDHLKAQMKLIQGEYGQGYWAQHIAQRKAMRDAAAGEPNAGVRSFPVDTAYIPVLLGRYSDATEKFSPLAFQQLLFDGPNPTGTVTEFYWQNSFNQLYVTGSVEQWFSAPRTFGYYVHDGGSNNAGLVYGGRDFTIDILAKADSLVDFSRYIKGPKDANNRWHVPQLAVIHTGADAAGGADNIWSHRWNIRQRLLTRKAAGSDPYFDVNRVTTEGYYITNDVGPDGAPVVFNGDYAIEPELSGSNNNGTKLIEMGVFSHEFGHVFGLPDLYDTDNSSEGLGNWCVMAGGSWGSDGSHPASPSFFSAWCKEFMGWVTPAVITTYTKAQQIRNAEDFPEIYKLWRLGTPGQQYFLIENRQKVHSDMYLPSGGLLIFHVDNSQGNNTNENHYRVDLEQADGARALNLRLNRGDNGDPFPGSTGNRTFDEQSTPNSKDYTPASTYVGVRKISNSAMTMTADLDVGTRPYLVLNSYTVSEGAGANGNGRVEPGESGTLKLRFSNVHPTAGSNLQVSVHSSTSGASVDTTVSFSIAGMALDSVVIARCFSIAAGFTPREVPFTVSVALSQDTLQFSGTTIFGYPPILFVDRDSTAENVVRWYRDAADANGKAYESFRTQGNSFSSAAFSRRQLIIWFTGRTKTNTIPDSAQQELQAFFQAGNSVFVTGQNIAEDLKSQPGTFLQQFLHARWSKNILVGRNVFGSSTDFFGAQMPRFVIAGAGGAANQTSPDELNPDSVSHPFLRYNSATGTSYAGLWYEDSVTHGKLVFLGFGFEAISDSAGLTTKTQVLNSLLNWFSGVTAVPGEGIENGIAAGFTLAQNYPNPFNPMTTIEYSIPVGTYSSTSLRVYDLLGREVAVLVNEKKAPGTYSVSFDAKGLASGVYFYRLIAGQYVESRKMVLMK